MHDFLSNLLLLHRTSAIGICHSMGRFFGILAPWVAVYLPEQVNFYLLVQVSVCMPERVSFYLPEVIFYLLV
jgi:hypothetical protein